MLDQLNCSKKDFIKQYPWLDRPSGYLDPIKVFDSNEKSKMIEEVVDLFKLIDENISLRPYLNESQRVMIALKLLPLIRSEQEEKVRRSRIKAGETRNPQGRKGKAKDNVNSPELLKEKARIKEANSTPGRIASIATVTPHFVKMAIKATENQKTETIEQIIAGNITIKDLIKSQKNLKLLNN